MKSRKGVQSKKSRKHGTKSRKSKHAPVKRTPVEEMSITQLTNLARSYGIPFYGLTRSKLEKKLKKYL